MKKDDRSTTVLIAVILLAAFFRLYGLNWDSNQHLHPDERYLSLIALEITQPESISDYFNPQISPANPHNTSYGFYVYGTFPLYLAEVTDNILKLNSFHYYNVTLVGRLLSAFLDLGTVLLVFLIAGGISGSRSAGILAAFFYSLSVLPIQLAHFFTVDTFLVFFLTFSFYILSLMLLRPPGLSKGIFLGIAFGLAIACKVSALLFIPIIGLGFVFIFLRSRGPARGLGCMLLFLLTAYISLRIADPRFFASANFLDPTINPRFLNDLFELSSKNGSTIWFPPAVQWFTTKPLVFPLANMLLWGLGLPLGLLILVSFIAIALQTGRRAWLSIRRRQPLSAGVRIELLMCIWVLLLIFYAGSGFAKALRYLYPLYPFLAVIAAIFARRCALALRNRNNDILVKSFCLCGGILLLLWPLSFISIYARPHARLAASRWIYRNIPPGTFIAVEHWDDLLPLRMDGKSPFIYEVEELAVFNRDTPGKWKKINEQLEKTGYLILSSNRGWGAIPRVPERYPHTSRFYRDLLGGKLNFSKVAEFSSYPLLPLPFLGNLIVLRPPEFGIRPGLGTGPARNDCLLGEGGALVFVDDGADETFTVYDHPKVMIFQKNADIIR